MWNRRNIKERARECMKANYWRTVLVSLLMGGLLAGGVSASSLGGSTSSIDDIKSLLNGDLTQSYDDQLYGSPSSGESSLDQYMEDYLDNSGQGYGGSSDGGSFDYGDEYYDDGGLDDFSDFFTGEGSYDDSDPGDLPGLGEYGGESPDDGFPGDFSGRNSYGTIGGLSEGTIALLIGIFIFAALIIALISLALTAFLWNPLSVGCSRFFVQNLRRKAMVGEVGYGFDENYRTHVVTMLLRDIFVFLWSLLLVVPGIVKYYEYMMVPYILTDNPNISRQEAFAISRDMMYGNKWKAFVLDLSFIGWFLLSGLTMGILWTFYVNPYYQMTHAALYEELCAIRFQSAPQQPYQDIYNE